MPGFLGREAAESLGPRRAARPCGCRPATSADSTPPRTPSLPGPAQGEYPAVMRARAGNRLPRFTRKQREALAGSADFFGLNHFTTQLAEAAAGYKEHSAASERGARARLPTLASADQLEPAPCQPAHPHRYLPLTPRQTPTSTPPDGPPDPCMESHGYHEDMGVVLSHDPAWKMTAMGWGVHPEGMRRVLNWVQVRARPRRAVGRVRQRGCCLGLRGARRARPACPPSCPTRPVSSSAAG
jgi:hypothetical protein